jgi:phosphoadenosine phosphosulfate reductase
VDKLADRSRVAEYADALEGRSPEDIIRWTADAFGDQWAVGSSFGAEAMVIMDLVVKVKPDTPFVFLETDFHFQDTLALVERAKKRYNLNLVIARTKLTPEQQAAQHGDQLYFQAPERCCELRKIEPMREALAPHRAWMTGMRKDQTEIRAGLRHAEWDGKFGLVKISPILNWSWSDVWNYIETHDVPYNRLHKMGYPSIGCAPCTKPVKPGEDPRAGRWAGFDKTECGLHTG